MSAKAFTRSFSIISISLLTACSGPRYVPAFSQTHSNYFLPSANYSHFQQTLNLAPFHKIMLEGNLKIIIKGHQWKNQLQTYASSDQWQNLQTHVINGVLYISYRDSIIKNTSQPLTITITTAQDINYLTDRGNGELITQNIGDNNISVLLKENIKAQMNGNLVFQTLMLNGHSQLFAYWVNSTNLQILTFNQAKVSIAGIVTHLDIQAHDQSAIDARYLRVTEGFVKTTDSANVGVNARDRLSTWASNQSSIYYYHGPLFNSSTLSAAGSSLRMAGIYPLE